MASAMIANWVRTQVSKIAIDSRIAGLLEDLGRGARDFICLVPVI
jgi:hypothetical protein